LFFDNEPNWPTQSGGLRSAGYGQEAGQSSFRSSPGTGIRTSFGYDPPRVSFAPSNAAQLPGRDLSSFREQSARAHKRVIAALGRKSMGVRPPPLRRALSKRDACSLPNEPAVATLIVRLDSVDVLQIKPCRGVARGYHVDYRRPDAALRDRCAERRGMALDTRFTSGLFVTPTGPTFTQLPLRHPERGSEMFVQGSRPP